MAAHQQLLALMSSASGHNNNNSPEPLYDLALNAVVNSLDCKVPALGRISKLPELPRNLLIDVYERISQRDDLKDSLLEELSKLRVFRCLVRFTSARNQLLRIVASLMASNKSLTRRLSEAYEVLFSVPQIEQPEQSEQVGDSSHKLDKELFSDEYSKMQITEQQQNAAAGCSSSSDSSSSSSSASLPASTTTSSEIDDHQHSQLPNVTVKLAHLLDDLDDLDDQDALAIDLGLRLGSFLSEAGWMQESISVLSCLNERLKRMPPFKNMLVTRVDCLQRLLYAESSHCNFKLAQQTYAELIKLAPMFDRQVPSPLIAMAYTQISSMYFARNEYNNSHMWSVKALHHLHVSAPTRVAIDVLRQAAKACVVKRDFARANLLICQAVRRAREHFGPTHQKYGDALLDYGFFLLNVDSVFQSVNVYKEALAVRRGIFGNMNFHVAIAHEDLSYAYYVHEYSTGDFSCAQDHVDKAVNIMKNLVPSNHLMLASAKRVKALLLEEIALDKIADGMDEEDLLLQSEELHNFALQLSLEVFGEVNVQTAKHYGNLGRLYQTMNRFDEAERMHQKAIKIKTDLLGPYDYEVGLSIGHLASLYNYQMKKFRQAEDLYLRSIDISLRLFGSTYSGLEYDYLGLCHVYETLHEFEKYLRYAHILENWQLLRGQNLTQNKSSYPAIEEDYSIDLVKAKFFTENSNTHKNVGGASSSSTLPSTSAN
ncbi:amyloid protein-binding protein 2 [Drosophila albomicans]|uniref:Amyloid protein-binding protein 2 n=1 Tax=Drosophila albomicans TaxID=7291 RepID=A0A6P8XAI6_DROAB|nr:amyloid protein-binding protein 2 [Drosophila albomicans]XP_034109653.1 amyloid protein-binding protein 2 [Drosophila albomicans]XP_034109659.1 amyloid protein-binding protein 2 [Drosophila albomicans]